MNSHEFWIHSDSRLLCTLDAKHRQLTTLHSLDGGFTRGVFIGGKKTVIPAHSGAQAGDWRMLASVTARVTQQSVLLEGCLSNDLKVVGVLKGNKPQRITCNVTFKSVCSFCIW